MANLEIVGENLRCYLYIYINDKTYCLNKDNSRLNIELPQGKHTMFVIGTKTKNYKLDNSLKSTSFSFRPTLLQLYKDRKILNHIIGWNNQTYFFIKKIEFDIRSNPKISFSVGNYYRYNFFDVKEVVKDVKITKNAHIKNVSVQNYDFVTISQKLKYYVIQAMLLCVKYIINIIFPVMLAVTDINYIIDPVTAMAMNPKAGFELVWLSLSAWILIFAAFAFRFVFYFVKLIKRINDDSDILIKEMNI